MKARFSPASVRSDDSSTTNARRGGVSPASRIRGAATAGFDAVLVQSVGRRKRFLEPLQSQPNQGDAEQGVRFSRPQIVN